MQNVKAKPILFSFLSLIKNVEIINGNTARNRFQIKIKKKKEFETFTVTINSKRL